MLSLASAGILLLLMNLGTSEITSIKLGSNEVPQIYLGETPVLSFPDGYDVFLVAGQSNTYAGEILEGSGDTQPDATLDSTDADIFQWGRFSPNNNTVIPAVEPLDHTGKTTGTETWVGWALTFAKKYKQAGFLAGNRKILIIPCGKGSTGFGSGDWNKGDTLYEDAITRTLAALATGSDTNILKAILWHQGENDSQAAYYLAHEAALLQMIDDMRTDLNAPDVPFIAGGMLPSHFQYNPYKETVEAGIANIVNNRTYTGYADPNIPTVLTGKNATSEHYSGRSVRGYPTQDFTDLETIGLAGRYWTAYLSALSNTQ